MLQAGAKPDCRNGQGELPLHTAAREGELPLVKLFIEKGIDVNATDWLDRTALELTQSRRYTFASDRKDHFPVIAYLRGQGAK